MEDFKTESDNVLDLIAALANVQAVIENAKKDTANPFFKTKYADLTAIWGVCLQPLVDNGLLITQVVKDMSLITTVYHVKTGQWMRSKMPLLLDKAAMQPLGSAVTYARRYSLAAILNVCSDDDDGEKAHGRTNGKTDKEKSEKVQAINSDDEPKMQEFLKSQPEVDHLNIREFFSKYAAFHKKSVGKAIDDFKDKVSFDNSFKSWKKQHGKESSVQKVA